jgi:hypothetical protein
MFVAASNQGLFAEADKSRSFAAASKSSLLVAAKNSCSVGGADNSGLLVSADNHLFGQTSITADRPATNRTHLQRTAPRSAKNKPSK